MRHVLKPLVFATLTASPLHAEGCNHGLTNLAKPFVDGAIKLREERKYDAAITALQRTPAGGSSFCILYELGRNHLNIDANDIALKHLQNASGIASMEDRQQQAIFNIIGYAWLQKKEYGNAIMAFERQMNDDQFSALSAEKQTKVFNNAGYTYMKLNQYPSAKVNFEKALANGSKLAAANLAKLESLIQVQTAGDINVPGIFSVSLHSQRGDDRLTDKLNMFADKLNVPSTQISVYRRETGMLTFTLGINLSYAKAQNEMAKAQAIGLNDAQIVSTANWENLSYTVNKPQLLKALEMKKAN